ncbi:deoxyribose-phosphate aldolase [Aerococcaceae bacterium DSM 111020]|nr:deoxyribose-phosphate aldolase [Aerococcaceae bacterium DSM 111020]
MELNKFIDHTLLKADANQIEIDTLIQEAREYDFKSVCINPTWVAYAAEQLKDDDVLVCTVIGFPLGATSTAAKVAEANIAIDQGADELDMVINIGAVKSGNWYQVQQDIQSLVEILDGRAILKVIIETGLLTEEEKVKVCEIAKEAGAHFVKTSTGFSTGGATIADVKLMRETVSEEMGVKASGGVSNRQEALDMIEAGATRIGASKGIAIVNPS